MKEVIILAKGSSRLSCPYDAEVWGVNDVCETIPSLHHGKIARLFAFDDLDANYISNMKATGIPIYSFQDYADSKYPIDEIDKEFGNTGYFINTIAYMIAMAIYEGYEKIRFYGVDMTHWEYLEEMRGVEFWVGIAVGRKVIIDASACPMLIKTKTKKRYGG